MPLYRAYNKRMEGTIETEIFVDISFEMHFQQIRKYKEDKIIVRNGGKYKYEECVHVTAIDGRCKKAQFLFGIIYQLIKNALQTFDLIFTFDC